MCRHLVDGELQALRDGATGRWHALGLRMHLARCPECRARLHEIGEAGERVAAMLGRLTPEVAVSEGWARVMVRSGAPARLGGTSMPSFLMGGLVGAAACVAVFFIFRPTGAPLEQTFRSASAGAIALLDHCCADHDGDGIANEGLLTVHGGDGQKLTLVYSDLDGSGNLSRGDVIIRAISTSSTLSSPVAR